MEEEIPTIYKEFTDAICGNRFQQSIEVKNKSKEKTQFTILPILTKRFNNGLERLLIHPETANISPGKTGRFILTYLSYLENTVDNIRYNLLESGNIIRRLNVCAQSVGPLVSCKSNTLKFLWFHDVKETKKRIEFTNKKNSEFKFCFDIDKNNQIFSISPLCGVNPAGTNLKIDITFQPKEDGIYSKRIFCLFQFQEPLIINVIGIYKRKLKLESRKLYFNKEFPKNLSNLYEIYMQKLHQNIMQKIEQISYSKKYVEEYEKYLEDQNADTSKIEKIRLKRFPCDDNEKNENTLSSASVSMKSDQEITADDSDQIFLTTYYIDITNKEKIPNATTLVNLSALKRYYFQWQNDYYNHFQIEPLSGIIFPAEKINFTLIFTPSYKDQLYHKEIDLRIFPPPDKMENNIFELVQLPLTLSLKILGHAFDTDPSGWIPQCKLIPKILQLPSCVPGEVVYATFMIERSGHLPVNFATFLPKESNYTVQPVLGCIYNDFQLFVVEFNGKSIEGVYVEDLKIVYNNSSENFDFIKLRTSVEIPELTFAEENSFNFDCKFPGSKTEAIIPIENCTNLHLRFELEVPQDILWLEIPNSLGVIEPMSTTSTKVIFKPKEACEYVGQIMCKVYSTSKEDYYELIQVQFTGSCQYGYLIATPNSHDFGECIYNEKKEILVHLFNFSPVVFHYQLIVQSTEDFPDEDFITKRNVKIKPEKGFMLGKASSELIVMIRPHEKGKFEYNILCLITENDSENAVPCDKPTTVFTFRFTGVLPTFQIIDLNVENGGPLFSPDWIWKMLSVDSLNERLNSVESDVEGPLTLHFPIAMQNSPKLTITLLLEANQYGEISWKVKKNVFCTFMTSENSSISRAVTIIPEEGKLNPKSRIKMYIIVSYESLEEYIVEFKILFPHNRKISLNCTVISFPDEEVLPTSILMPAWDTLSPIFIGDEDPPLQLFWLYNNTFRSSFFNVKSIIVLNTPQLNQNIITCINPNGVIPPFSCVPLKILFKPTEIKTYKVNLTLIIKDDFEVHIRLKGVGIRKSQRFSEWFFEKSVPEKPILLNENIDLVCNVNFINVPIIKSFSQAKRIFFILNRSEKDTWAFQWHSFSIEDLIKAHVEPCKGKIEPGQKAIMTLVLNSFGYCSEINFSLPCDIVNYSLLIAYKSYDQFYNSASDNLKDYFTITEKGMTYEIADVTEPRKPEYYHLFLTVNTNVYGPCQGSQKLLVEEEALLNSSKEVEFRHELSANMTPIELPLFRSVLEKMLWNILNNEYFQEKWNLLSTYGDSNYLEMLASYNYTKKGKASSVSSVLPKNVIQSYLEDILQNIIYKNCRKENVSDDP